MIQQALMIVVVAVAMVYIGRYLVDSIKEVLHAKSGCGGGCARCAFAEIHAKKGATRPMPRASVIPLTLSARQTDRPAGE